MAGLRDIKTRIQSVKNTRKITYAMKLVSAAKLRRAQDAVQRAREYTKGINSLLETLIRESQELLGVNALCEERPIIKNIGVIIVGGARGLCGGYNTNVNRKIDSVYKELSASNPGANIVAYCLGKKPAEYLKRTTKTTLLIKDSLPEDPTKWPLSEVLSNVEKDFIDSKIDKVYLIFTQFKSALSMLVESKQILPMSTSVSETGVPGKTIIEPNIETIFNAVMTRVLHAQVLQACLDSKASEHASRMTAMDAATKNAGDLTKRLQLTYNKLRQASITAELLDIIGGAEAIS